MQASIDRRPPEHEELRYKRSGMLGKLLGKKTADRMSDGFRGRPDADLSEYAASRGLRFAGQSSQGGYQAAFTIAPELQWNVMRGVLPGGRPPWRP